MIDFNDRTKEILSYPLQMIYIYLFFIKRKIEILVTFSNVFCIKNEKTNVLFDKFSTLAFNTHNHAS